MLLEIDATESFSSYQWQNCPGGAFHSIEILTDAFNSIPDECSDPHRGDPVRSNLV